MTTTFEELTAGLTDRPGAHLAQALGMDPTEMFNAWTHNIAAFIKEGYENALSDLVRDAYHQALTCKGGEWHEWEALLISIKGLSPYEVRVLAMHGFRSSDITIGCWAVDDGPDRLRRFIPNGSSQWV